MLKMRCLLFVMVAMLLGTSSISSRMRSDKGRAPKFSSAYTDMRRDCKSALTKEEERDSEARGQDTPQRCKGYGRYHVMVGYTGVGAEQIHIAPDFCNVCKNEDIVLLIPHDQNPRATATARRVEWRLVDGKPFAVIVRFSRYDPPDNFEGSPFQDRYKVGELLLVRGLKGYERVDFDVDAKTPGANERAREMADNAFMRGR